MKNIVKKLLVTTAAFIVMSGSLSVGTLRVLAEQYYGWDDGTQEGGTHPSFLYVTPKYKPVRSTNDQFIVYCFNKERSYPNLWEIIHETAPSDLPIYEKKKGDDTIFLESSKSRKTSLTASLVAVLANGYPNKKLGSLDENNSRRLTQLAIWYFTDNYPKKDFKSGYELSDQEDKLLQELIEIGESATSKKEQEDRTLDIYVTTSYSPQSKPYQNLLGSTLIPKKEVPKEPKEPKQPEVPDINVEIVKPEFSEKPLKDPELPESKPKPTPKPEIPKEEDLGTVIGGGNVVETTEDTATGSQGGAHNGVVSIQENKDPIVEETYESSLPGQSGQSGSTTEVEDTKGPDVLIGGQGEIVDFEETLPTEQGQSGSTTEVEDTKGPDVLIGGQGEIVDFEETLPTEQGQSGYTIEVEDTKGADVLIGGQGEIVEFEETLPTEQGQSGSATEVEDTKGPDVMIGGPGEIVEFEETLPNEHGQSSSTTEVEDSKPKISIHFDNEWPKEEKPQLPAVEKPKAKVSLPATGEAEHVLSTIVGAMILFLVSLWGLLKRKASKA
ncbi:thioester-forming surface-anchored protein [Streptococcus dysgalactiae]|uniref:Thioester-forming surface-anchored protein n=1 Tax=Streptococcus dysgalactiae TaxID=1334 RepID=A0AAE9ULW1_STRDY|nr:thioester-forming surface-anchored protein [Streptococcus dysgalactiae]QGH04161.1 thioester-forming surface-anchored protein [Streptococcus dysgalactiae subsp. dysgalactiae]WAI92919.1 thioester-forming surface-anchored protein [Streptococcus dysgalactiae]WCE85528.1 thioester-forming surface-anchored protein [Streptococcus dysgalactiae]WCN25528.1 thioester-forming surface-anchored protein [Streptococcus dysgalactiae]BBE41222.1 fibronectin binding repeat protein [Streptococcus dysgalactiae]